jgi:Streptomycin adenylyltransferase
VLLTSTRAIPGAEVDAFSDYDAVLVVGDIGSFAADREGLLRPTAADELLRRHRVVLVGDAPGAVHLA